MNIFTKRRVLVVDDNAHARAFLVQILAAVDVEAVQAASGPEALAILDTLQLDAVFVDMFMQPMDGIALTRAIRASNMPEVAALPIIMASAQASRDVVSGGAAAGVTGFVAKPFSPAAVLTRLSSALAPRQTAVAPPAPARSPAAPAVDAPDSSDSQAMAYL